MNTIAIVGAGKGLGIAAARRFGREGLAIALISRSPERVASLAEQLRSEGLSARGYSANVRDRPSLIAALDSASQDLGPIEVLQYSPLPQKEFLRPVLETTAEDLIGAFEFSVLGPVAAAHQVLQGMRSLGRGSILFVNGGSGAKPNRNVAGTSIAFAAEAAFARMLREAVADDGIQVGQLIIPKGIRDGDPTHDPQVLADRLWHLHTHPVEFRIFAEPMPNVS
ncbi:SDR family NAD(P)-dependent oxidoreductase [Diaminobutyricibacter sp. McL0618]|uniref:SDR family NAD(P)-dependent oxidoreductase n=1 Tax=Leifsonia sp. McL0618 TaxID=3415677 RepID=UPI003CEF83DA